MRYCRQNISRSIFYKIVSKSIQKLPVRTKRCHKDNSRKSISAQLKVSGHWGQALFNLLMHDKSRKEI